jgi:hypothetical protein
VRGLGEHDLLLRLELGTEAREVPVDRGSQLGVDLPQSGQERLPQAAAVHRVV